MKSTLALLLVSAIPAAAPLSAQTAAAPAAAKNPIKTTTHRTSAAGGACAKLPELSPKIPALPAGLPCAKPLYTVTTRPAAHLDYVSPLEGPDLAETLGVESSTFSLDFVDTKIGTGQLAPPGKFYSIHYTGYLVDGTKFDSSLDRGEPITIPYGKHRVIVGWDTGFAGMRVGGKRRLFIPYQLGYGTQPHQAIPAKSMLIFDVELVSVSDTEPKPKTPPARPLPPPAANKPATPGASPTVTPVGAPTVIQATPPPAAPTAKPPATTAPASPATPPAATTPKP